MTTAPRAIALVTFMLIVNTVVASAGVLPSVVHLISASGLLVVPWMVVVVLRDTSVRIRELEPGQEWGYQDRPDLRPGR